MPPTPAPPAPHPVSAVFSAVEETVLTAQVWRPPAYSPSQERGLQPMELPWGKRRRSSMLRATEAPALRVLRGVPPPT